MCSAALFELSRHKDPVSEIIADEAFSLYGQESGGNPWLHFFSPPDVSKPAHFSEKNPFGRRLRHHSDYSTLPIKRAQPYIQRYFQPSPEVYRKKTDLISKYSVRPEKTITLWYRGTDKGSEIDLDSPEKYLEQAQSILRRNPLLRVHIQTDQEQVRSFLATELGDRGFFFTELPVSSADEGIHFTTPAEEQIQSGQDLLAAVLIASSSRHLITHTGNVALWTVLYRGNTRRTIQLGKGSS